MNRVIAFWDEIFLCEIAIVNFKLFDLRSNKEVAIIYFCGRALFDLLVESRWRYAVALVKLVLGFAILLERDG